MEIIKSLEKQRILHFLSSPYDTFTTTINAAGVRSEECAGTFTSE